MHRSMVEIALLLSLPVIEQEIKFFRTVFNTDLKDMPKFEGEERFPIDYVFSGFFKGKNIKFDHLTRQLIQKCIDSTK